MSRRHIETITDCLIVAISPALVIVMVSSLVFFVEHCFYAGSFDGRLRVASGLFVMAAVLIARISIEEGREYASMFAVPLSIVSILSMLKYTDIGLLLVLPLVAFIWWSTAKLTWDCTVIDDQQDASGEGLLETIGLEGKGEEDVELNAQATTDKARSDQQTLWQRWLAHRRRHHAPGVWVVYFGIAAIPLFGLGQLLLSAESRGPAFLLLCIYVASALALLMTTSFLQMRRYLNQRRLPFTDQMASIWLASGGMIIVVLMLFCLLLPRPNTGYSLIDSIAKVSSKDRRASKYAIGKEGAHDNQREGNRESDEEPASSAAGGQQQTDNASDGRRPGDDAQAEGGDRSASGKSDDSSRRNEDAAGKGAGQDQDDEQAEGSRDSQNEGQADQQNSRSSEYDSERPSNADSPGQTPPSTPPSFVHPLQNFSLPSIPKLIYFALIALLVLFVLFRYGRELIAAIGAFIRDLQEMIRRLLGGASRTSVAESTESEEAAIPQRPFSSYQDPFAMGTADRFTPQQLVNYSFEALQAWARERNCGRSNEQTALEFAAQVGVKSAKVGPFARNLAVLYNRAAYSPGSLGQESIDHVRLLWTVLRGPSSA